MRPIKFRAWNRYDRKKMEYDLQGKFLSDCILMTQFGKSVMGPCAGAEDVILMQFTGLLDKNGKKIWEGDILGVPNPTLRYVVKFGYFDNEMAYDSWQGGTGFYIHNENEGDEGKGHLFDVSAYKVLGNIYENPDLLNQEAL